MVLKPTIRQRRVLAALAQEDLLWEVPGQPYFTQYNERTGKQTRVHLNILETMEKAGWIRRVSEEPSAHKLDFYQLTTQGRDLVMQFTAQRRSSKSEEPEAQVHPS